MLLCARRFTAGPALPVLCLQRTASPVGQAQISSPFGLLEPSDPVYAWRERLLDAHGGLARRAKGYPVA